MLDYYELIDQQVMADVVIAECPLCAILRGEKAGDVVYQDDLRRLAIIAAHNPEGAVHWLAVPYEHIEATTELSNGRFAELAEFAIQQAQQRAQDHPHIEKGFTIKFHCGAFETVPHAKLHILSTE